MKDIAINTYLLAFLALMLVGTGCIQESETDRTTPAAPETIEQESTDQKSVIDVEVKEDLSVLDYYHLIPREYLPFTEGEDRDLSIDVLDEVNHYISLAPRSWDGAGSVAVFLHGDREFVVAEWRGCGPLCEQWVYVLEYVNGAWIDRTDEIWTDVAVTRDTAEALTAYALANNFSDDPDDVPIARLYELPRFGTTVRVYDQFTGQVFAKMDWQNGTFHPRPIEVGSESVFDY